MAEVGVSGIEITLDMFIMQWYVCMHTSTLMQLHTGVMCILCASVIIVPNSTILGGNFTVLSHIIIKKPVCKENHFYSLPFGQAEASIYGRHFN